MRKYIALVETAQQMSLPDAIRQMIARYAEKNIAARDVGNGHCDDFAEDVLELWQGDDWIYREGHENWQTVETMNFTVQEDDDPIDWDWALLENHWGITPPKGYSLESLKELAMENPNHVWIADNRMHYDAESPDGVSSFFDLQFFRRWLSSI